MSNPVNVSLALDNTPWALERRALDALSFCASNPDTPLAASLSRTTLKPEAWTTGQGTRVIPIGGVIMRGGSAVLSKLGVPVVDPDAVRAAVDGAAADPKVKGVLLYIASPGGGIAGMDELLDSVDRARAAKKVDAYIQDVGTSAAYWIASHASFIYANRTAEVGGVGVYSTAIDASRAFENAGYRVHVMRSGAAKGGYIMGAEIPSDALRATQENTDALAESFFADVAAQRRKIDAAIMLRVKTGRTWIAPEARLMGLVDAIAGFDEALHRAELAAGVLWEHKTGGKARASASDAGEHAFMVQSRAYAKAHGIGLTLAMKDINKANPGLHASYVEWYKERSRSRLKL